MEFWNRVITTMGKPTAKTAVRMVCSLLVPFYQTSPGIRAGAGLRASHATLTGQAMLPSSTLRTKPFFRAVMFLLRNDK